MSILTAIRRSKVQSTIPNSKYIRTQNDDDKSEPKKEETDTPAETEAK